MYSEQTNILIVDDEQSITDLLSEDLTEEGFKCITARNGEDALKRLSNEDFDILLLDLKLPGMPGMDVLKKAKTVYPDTAVIIISALGDAETAVEAMKLGAADYITKPFDLDRINNCIKEVMKTSTSWDSIPGLKQKGTNVEGGEVDWVRYLDDIAEGVEARLSSLTGHVMTLTVIASTIEVARSLEIPEESIQEWADARRKHMERINILDALLGKAGQNNDN